MNMLKIAGAILVLGVCISSVAAQTACPDGTEFPTYTDGTDFYQNDINSGDKGSSDVECVAACAANPECYAIVLKADDTCWLKGVSFASNTTNLANTVLAVDLSCLRGAPPAVLTPLGVPPPGDATGSDTTPPPADAGTPPAVDGVPPGAVPGTFVLGADGVVTATSTVEVEGGAYVTTVMKYAAADYDGDTTNDVDMTPEVTSFYSDAAGVPVEGSEAIATPTVTATPPTGIIASTAVTDQAAPIITTMVPAADGTPKAVYAEGGVVTEVPSPPVDAVPTPPTTPVGTPGVVTPNADGTSNVTNTIMVPNSNPPAYVTIETVVNSTDPSSYISSRAFYSDAAGAPIPGFDDLNVTTTTNPNAVYPEGVFVSTVTVPETGETLTSTGVVDPTTGALTSYGYDGVAVMPPPLDALSMPPPTSVGGGAFPPPPKTLVPIAPKEAGSSAQGLQMVGAFVAVTLFSALML